jgi:predicted GNAT superfamily acetyltransferase
VARRAAQRSGVAIRPLSELPELAQVTALFDGIWRREKGDPMVGVEQLRAMTHAGNYLAGAFDRGTLVGASLGFFAAPPGVALHSHITGIADHAQGRHIGFALKLHQRAWALARGLREITWTYDPLVRRNAYFNLVKLGARPHEYLVDFYGDIADAINAGQGSDRLFVVWDLASPGVVDACAGRATEADPAALTAAGAQPALITSTAGQPVVIPDPLRRPGAVLLVRVPADIEALRATDPGLARHWRLAVREILGGPLTGEPGEPGARITGFARDGWYVVERAGR